MRPFVASLCPALVLCASSAFAQDLQPLSTPAAPPAGPVVQVPSGPPVQSTTTVDTAPGTTPGVPAQHDSVEKISSTQMIEDGGLGLEWAYLNADVGMAYTDLVSLKNTHWDLQDNTSAGAAFGIAGGVRLLFLSLGVQARDLQLSSFNMWETDLEAALHFRVWRIDSYLGARGGYAFLGAFSADSLRTSTGNSASDVTVHGWNVGPMFGMDAYFSKRISVGFDANAEVLFLKRPPLALQPGQTVAPAYQPLYAESGSSVGAGFVGMAHLGVHF